MSRPRLAPFTVFDVRPGSITRGTRSVADFGLAVCSAESLAGGTAAQNAAALRAVLRGEDRGPHRDALLLGAALALEVAGSPSADRAKVCRARRARSTTDRPRVCSSASPLSERNPHESMPNESTRMSEDFLDGMRRSSAARVARAQQLRPEQALQEFVRRLPPPPAQCSARRRAST